MSRRTRRLSSTTQIDELGVQIDLPVTPGRVRQSSSDSQRNRVGSINSSMRPIEKSISRSGRESVLLSPRLTSQMARQNVIEPNRVPRILYKIKNDYDIINELHTQLSIDDVKFNNRDEVINYNFELYCGLMKKCMNSNFNIVHVPANVYFFKGFNQRDCDLVRPPNSVDDQHQQRAMWMSTYEVALRYSHNILCYKTIRPLLLFELTDVDNLMALIELIRQKNEASSKFIQSNSVQDDMDPLPLPLTDTQRRAQIHKQSMIDTHKAKCKKYLEQTKTVLYTTGIHCTLEEQVNIFPYEICDPRLYNSDSKFNNRFTLNRISFFELDLLLSEILREHLPWADGYYGCSTETSSPSSPSGRFHKEVCIFGSNGRCRLMPIDGVYSSCDKIGPSGGSSSSRSTSILRATDAPSSSMAYNDRPDIEFEMVLNEYTRSYICPNDSVQLEANDAVDQYVDRLKAVSSNSFSTRSTAANSQESASRSRSSHSSSLSRNRAESIPSSHSSSLSRNRAESIPSSHSSSLSRNRAASSPSSHSSSLSRSSHSRKRKANLPSPQKGAASGRP